MTSRSVDGWTQSFVGRTLARRYRIVRVLGEGGVGAVFEAEHLAVGHRVAIKVLLPEFVDKGSVVERFHREARAAAACARSGVVEVTDLDHDPSSGPFLVMEYLQGETLADRLTRRGAMGVSQALSVVLPMLETLAAVHARGIIHRDLKPGNVFLAIGEHGTEVVKILDFGMARSPAAQGGSSPLTLPGHVLGTPRYMAPEQALGDPSIDARADLYAVGAILYTCLGGRPPYAEVSADHALGAVLTGPPRPLGEIRPGLPPGAIAVVERAMARDPNARFPDAVEMLRVLRTLGEPTPLGAAPTLDLPVTPSLGAPSGPSVAPVAGSAPRAIQSTVPAREASYATVGARPGALRPGVPGPEIPPTGAHATMPVDPAGLARLAAASSATPAPGAHPGAGPVPGQPFAAHAPPVAARAPSGAGRLALLLAIVVGALGAGALVLALLLVSLTNRDEPARASALPSPAPIVVGATTNVAVAPIAPPVTSALPSLSPEALDAAIPAHLRAPLERGRAGLATGNLAAARAAYDQVLGATSGATHGSPESRARAYAGVGLGDVELAAITDVPPLASYGTTPIVERIQARDRAFQRYGDAMVFGAYDINTCATVRMGRADERLGDVLTRLRAARPAAEPVVAGYRSMARTHLSLARSSYSSAAGLSRYSVTCAEEGRLGMLRVQARLDQLPP
ncbi:MAG: protein kinase [Deltaproteobacteria bacterium]|nr:protein kinase [Deltaproteobacteria bacterium]